MSARRALVTKKSEVHILNSVQSIINNYCRDLPITQLYLISSKKMMSARRVLFFTNKG